MPTCVSARPRPTELRDALASARRRRCTSIEQGLLDVSGLTGEQIGEIALEERIVISELTPQQASLEEAFMSLTGESVEYRASAGRARTTRSRT